MLEASGTDAEVARLRQRLLSTEEALRNALEHNQEVDQLVQAMRTRPDKSQVKLHAHTHIHALRDSSSVNPLEIEQ